MVPQKENSNGSRFWSPKTVRDLGFPIFVCLAFLGGFGMVGKWLLSHLDSLYENVSQTNDTLIQVNRSNVEANRAAIEIDRENMLINRKSLEAQLANGSGIHEVKEISQQNGSMLKELMEVNKGLNETMNKAYETMKNVPATRERYHQDEMSLIEEQVKVLRENQEYLKKLSEEQERQKAKSNNE